MPGRAPCLQPPLSAWMSFRIHNVHLSFLTLKISLGVGWTTQSIFLPTPAAWLTLFKSLPQSWHLVSFWEASAPLKEQEAGEKNTIYRTLILGGNQHDLGSADLFARGLSRDPVVSYKKFAKTVMILLEGNLLNTVRLYIVNKRSLLCTLYAPHKVYSIKKNETCMLFCSLKNEKTEILNTISEISWEG